MLFLRRFAADRVGMPCCAADGLRSAGIGGIIGGLGATGPAAPFFGRGYAAGPGITQRAVFQISSSCSALRYRLRVFGSRHDRPAAARRDAAGMFLGSPHGREGSRLFTESRSGGPSVPSFFSWISWPPPRQSSYSFRLRDFLGLRGGGGRSALPPRIAPALSRHRAEPMPRSRRQIGRRPIAFSIRRTSSGNRLLPQAPGHDAPRCWFGRRA